MQKNLEIFYDSETDILELFLEEPTNCYFNEIDDDLFEGREEGTNKLIGFKIFNFRRRGGMKNIKIPLPVNVKIEAVN